MSGADTRPIFILGAPRTGTTLVQRLLNSYDDVLVWGEHAGIVEDVARAFYRAWEHPTLFRDVAPLESLLEDSNPRESWQAWMSWSTRDDWLRAFRAFVESLFVPQGLPGKRWWGFKEIRYMADPGDRTLEFLHTLYPDALFVFIVRNLFNAVASVTRIPEGAHSLAALERTCASWVFRYRAYRAWHTSRRSRSFWIVYEDMLEERGDVLALLGALGKTLGPEQRAVMRSAEGRWSSFKDEAFHERWRRLPRPWLALVAASLGDLNEELGFTNPPQAVRYRLAGRLLRLFVRTRGTREGAAGRAGPAVAVRPGGPPRHAARVTAADGSHGGAPRVSVIVPVYNMRAFVGEAIASVLLQTLAPEQVELIVVDDGSTDGSSEVIASHGPRVTYLRQENRGLAAARNAGIGAAHAPFLTFLDADDRFLPDKLAAQLALFDARPGLGLVYTGFYYVDAAGRPLPQVGWARNEGAVFATLVLGNLIHPHQALVRRDAVERVGGFDERLGPAADWDLWLRVSRDGLLWGCVDRALAEYRIRPDAMHQDVGRMVEDCLRVLGKVFADPTLPAAVAATKPLAYRRAFLTAACDHYRIGDRVAGARWLRAAAAAHPGFLTDPEAWRLFCRGLLPLGSQRGMVLVAELPRLAATLRLALADLFATPELDGAIARLRWRARLAAARALLPLARKRVQATLRGSRSRHG